VYYRHRPKAAREENREKILFFPNFNRQIDPKQRERERKRDSFFSSKFCIAFKEPKLALSAIEHSMREKFLFFNPTKSRRDNNCFNEQQERERSNRIFLVAIANMDPKHCEKEREREREFYFFKTADTDPKQRVRFAGEFVEGVRRGGGCLVWKDGAQYAGDW